MSRVSKKRPPRRKVTKPWQLPAACLSCEVPDTYHRKCVTTDAEYKGASYKIEVEKWVCRKCGSSFLSPLQATAASRATREAFQEANNLLTATEIREQRKGLGWTQNDLVVASGLSLPSIKRWESGVVVQTSANDSKLRETFANALRARGASNIYAVDWSPVRPVSKGDWINMAMPKQTLRRKAKPCRNQLELFDPEHQAS